MIERCLVIFFLSFTEFNDRDDMRWGNTGWVQNSEYLDSIYSVIPSEIARAVIGINPYTESAKYDSDDKIMEFKDWQTSHYNYLVLMNTIKSMINNKVKIGAEGIEAVGDAIVWAKSGGRSICN